MTTSKEPQEEVKTDITSVIKQLRHLTSQEVMQVLNCSKNHLTKMIRNGDVIAFRKGKFSYSYPPEQFTLEYITKKQEEKKALTKFGLKKGIK